MNRHTIDVEDLVITSSATPVPGTDCLVASHFWAPAPVAYLWYRHILVKHIDILNCYTHEYFRRNGVMSKLLVRLREDHPNHTITTAVGNELSTFWLLKNGFSKEESGWFLRPEQPCPMI